jgi:serine protease Do
MFDSFARHGGAARRVIRFASLAVILAASGSMAAQTAAPAPAPGTRPAPAQAARPATANAARPVTQPIVPPGPPGSRPAPASFADLADRLSRSVVNISTTQTLRRNNNRPQEEAPKLPEGSPFEDFFNEFMDNGQRAPRRVTSLGSGFVIDPSGLIVTNNHVIEDADEISVILNDGVTTLPATLVGRDEPTDLALLRVKPRTPLVTARLGDSDAARVGEWVVAIGNPFGLGGTVTAGIISARNRSISPGPYDDFIQTDASINRGNSGGPLFNMNGDVIGVNSAIYSPTGGSVGIGFAIPSNDVRGIINQLQRTGKVNRGMIGVSIQPITEEIAASMKLQSVLGALVSRVTPGGPAAKAGLQQGDVIVSFDGRPIANDRMLPRVVADTAIGKTSRMEYIRNGQKRAANVVVARLEEAAKPAENKPAPRAAPKLSSKLGLTLEALNPENRNRYRIADNVRGVLVTAIDAGGPAADKIKPGDVIVEVVQQKVGQPAEVEAKVDAEAKAGKAAVLLLVNRAGQQSFIGIQVKR